MTRIRASGAKIFAVFQLPTPTVRTLATGKALGFNPDQIYMNSVAAIKPAMDGAVDEWAGAAYVTGILSIAYGKDPQDPAWDNDPGDEALPPDHRQVRRRSEPERPERLLRGREGGDVRPTPLLGGVQTPPARAS